MENKEFTAQQSLAVIENMIAKAKQQLHDNGFFFLLWGWLVFIAAAAHYAMMKLGYEYAAIVWPVLMTAGGIVSVIYGAVVKRKKARAARTWIDKGMRYVWIGFGVSLFITLAVSSETGFEVTYPFLMIFYGLGTFVSGGMMGFRPLVIGGIIAWILAAVAFFVDFEYQLIILGGSMLTSYIIPGHILQYNYKKHVQAA